MIIKLWGEIHEVRKGIWAVFLDCALRVLIGWISNCLFNG